MAKSPVCLGLFQINVLSLNKTIDRYCDRPVNITCLGLPDARSRVVVKFGHLEDVAAALKVELMPQGREAAEGRGLAATISEIVKETGFQGEWKYCSSLYYLLGCAIT